MALLPENLTRAPQSGRRSFRSQRLPALHHGRRHARGHSSRPTIRPADVRPAGRDGEVSSCEITVQPDNTSIRAISWACSTSAARRIASSSAPGAPRFEYEPPGLDAPNNIRVNTQIAVVDGFAAKNSRGKRALNPSPQSSPRPPPRSRSAEARTDINRYDSGLSAMSFGYSR